jgi:hypothetical protein
VLRKRWGLALAIGVLQVVTAAAAESPKGAESRVKPVHLVPGAAWNGPQFVQADKKGRLFLLHGEGLTVFPLSADGKLGDPLPLSKNAGQAEGESAVTWAAMSRNGDWVVQDGFQARVFRGTKEQPVPSLKWFVGSMAFLGDDPVVAGSSRDVDVAHAGFRSLPAKVDLIARLTGDEWEPVVSSRTGTGPAKDAAALMDWRMVRLAGSSDGHLWAAADFAHRFREYSGAGKLLTEIVVGSGDVRRAGDAEARQKAADEEAAQLSQGKTKVRIFEETAEPVTKALAEGRDGRMYFLVLGQGNGSGEVSLERYEPASQILERLSVSMPDPGRGTMAAGRDGLYIAAYSAKQGIWRISWEQLQEGSWTPVDAGISAGGGGGAPGAVAPPKRKAESGARTSAAKAPAKKQPASSPRSSPQPKTE